MPWPAMGGRAVVPAFGGAGKGAPAFGAMELRSNWGGRARGDIAPPGRDIAPPEAARGRPGCFGCPAPELGSGCSLLIQLPPTNENHPCLCVYDCPGQDPPDYVQEPTYP